MQKVNYSLRRGLWALLLGLTLALAAQPLAAAEAQAYLTVQVAGTSLKNATGAQARTAFTNHISATYGGGVCPGPSPCYGPDVDQTYSNINRTSDSTIWLTVNHFTHYVNFQPVRPAEKWRVQYRGRVHENADGTKTVTNIVLVSGVTRI